MTATTLPIAPDQRWRRRAATWALALAALLPLLGISLHHRANPWVVQLTIPSGFAESDYESVWTERRYGADLALDGQHLAIAKPSGQVELWDLAQRRRTAILGDVLPPPPPGQDYPALHGAMSTRWFADQRHVALFRDNHCEVYGVDGSRVPIHVDLKYCWYFAPSPTEDLLAVAEHGRVAVIDIRTGRALHEWKFDYFNGGRTRLEWSPNGTRLLLNDRLGVRVWDVRAGKMLFFNAELDLSLPPPMIADERSGVRAAPIMGQRGGRVIAALEDACFAPDGSYVAVIYNDLDAMIGPGAAQANRVRFYAPDTGALLWESMLPQSPRGLAFAPDGSRMILTFQETPDYLIQVYDPARRQLLTNSGIDFPLRSSTGTTLFPDGRWFASVRRSLMLVDLHGQCAPLTLRGSPNVAQVIVAPDARHVIEVGMEKTARVWEQRRPASTFGAFALTETWLIYILSMAIPVLLVTLAGRDAARARDGPLPGAIWLAAIVAALSVGGAIANLVVGLAADAVYRDAAGPGPWTVAWRACVMLFQLAALVGVMRLRRGWWIVKLIMLTITLALLALAATAVFIAMISGSLKALPADSFHGWPFQPTPASALIIAGLATLLALAEGWLLVRPDVRSLFRRSRFLDDAERSRAFQLTLPAIPLASDDRPET